MFKQIKNILFSNKLMTILILIFAISIGVATFIENDFGTMASKDVVYNALWFEVLMVLLTINLIGNIFKYRMFQMKKISVLTFHLSFIVILIGAGITRYIGFEGSLRIREGEMNNKLISDAVYFDFAVDDGKMQYKPRFGSSLYFSELKNPSFEREFNFKDKEVEIEIEKFVPNAVYKPISSENGKKIIEIVRAGDQGRISEYLEFGKALNIGGLIFSFDNDKQGAINLSEKEGAIYVNSPYEIAFMQMADQFKDTLNPDTTHLFEGKRLFTCNGVNFVFKEYYPKGELALTKAEERKEKEMMQLL